MAHEGDLEFLTFIEMDLIQSVAKSFLQVLAIIMATSSIDCSDDIQL